MNEADSPRFAKKISLSAFLKRTSLFGFLPDHVLESANEVLSKAKLRRSTLVTEVGYPITHAFYVLSGNVSQEIMSKSDCRKYVFRTYGVGEMIFAVEALTKGSKPTWDYRAGVGGCELLRIPVGWIQELFNGLEVPSDLKAVLMTRMLNSSAADINLSQEKIKTFALLSIRERVIDALGLEPGKVQTYEKRLSRQTLAYEIGASREMVSRVMNDLIKEGMVDEPPCHHVVPRKSA